MSKNNAIEQHQGKKYQDAIGDCLADARAK